MTPTCHTHALSSCYDIHKKSNRSKRKTYNNQHRFEHWYRDNQVYFITAKTAHFHSVFTTPKSCSLYWSAFDKACAIGLFTPWVTTLMNNHYHTLGYLKLGNNLPKMMQSLHGSLAKQINDLIQAGELKLPRLHQQKRLRPFWGTKGKKNYFDGCIRDETQATRAFNYTRDQAVRANLVKHWHDYPNTRLYIPLEKALPRATQLNAFLRHVPYKRYEQGGRT